MTCYAIGFTLRDALHGKFYISLETAEKALEALEDGDCKIYKITVEECSQ
jgi:hypothetical protein